MSDPTKPAARDAREALTYAVVVTLATAAAVSFAFNPERAGKSTSLVPLAAAYAIFTAVALVRLHRRGELRGEMRPQSGDLTLGAVTGALLYGIATLGHLAVTSRGSPREGWIMRLYLQLGDPADERRILLGGAVFVIAALEELTWRGLILRSLEDPLGPTRAWLVSSLLFAVAHVPTVILLADPVAGPNPLIVSAALGCSFVWGFIAMRYRRLVPAIFAHALFSWAVVEFPIWRP
jgi:membrane protease YdiL (CAAX protease family)